ncbi:hypothetical protein COOONC_10839 [Cooperia oncophora]
MSSSYAVPSESAHNTICRCGCRYDKTGLMSWDHQCWPYYPRLRKQRDAEGKPKEGCPVTVERIASPKLIAKEFADVSMFFLLFFRGEIRKCKGVR